MRAPWLQVEMELIEVVAPELAVELGVTEHEAGWGLLRVFRMLLSRCKESMPPSLQAVLYGPKAAEKIAREAGYQGDPDSYVDACCRVAFAPFERIEGGVRGRGLKRYDALWRKNYPKAAAEWDASQRPTGPKSGRSRAEVGTKPGRSRDETGAPEPDTEPDTEEKPPPPTPPPAAELEQQAAAGEFWKCIQEERETAGLAREKAPPKGFAAWVAKLPRVPPEDYAEGIRRFLRDGKIKAKGHPTAVMITGDVFATRLPRRQSTAPPPPPCAACGKPAGNGLIWDVSLCGVHQAQVLDERPTSEADVRAWLSLGGSNDSCCDDLEWSHVGDDRPDRSSEAAERDRR